MSPIFKNWKRKWPHFNFLAPEIKKNQDRAIDNIFGRESGAMVCLDHFAKKILKENLISLEY